MRIFIIIALLAHICCAASVYDGQQLSDDKHLQHQIQHHQQQHQPQQHQHQQQHQQQHSYEQQEQHYEDHQQQKPQWQHQQHQQQQQKPQQWQQQHQQPQQKPQQWQQQHQQHQQKPQQWQHQPQQQHKPQQWQDHQQHQYQQHHHQQQQYPYVGVSKPRSHEQGIITHVTVQRTPTLTRSMTSESTHNVPTSQVQVSHVAPVEQQHQQMIPNVGVHVSHIASEIPPQQEYVVPFYTPGKTMNPPQVQYWAENHQVQQTPVGNHVQLVTVPVVQAPVVEQVHHQNQPLQPNQLAPVVGPKHVVAEEQQQSQVPQQQQQGEVVPGNVVSHIVMPVVGHQGPVGVYGEAVGQSGQVVPNLYPGVGHYVVQHQPHVHVDEQQHIQQVPHVPQGEHVPVVGHVVVQQQPQQPQYQYVVHQPLYPLVNQPVNDINQHQYQQQHQQQQPAQTSDQHHHQQQTVGSSYLQATHAPTVNVEHHGSHDKV